MHHLLGKNFQLHLLLIFNNSTTFLSRGSFPPNSVITEGKILGLGKLQTGTVKRLSTLFLFFHSLSSRFRERLFRLKNTILYFRGRLTLVQSFELIFSSFTDATQYAHYVFSTIKKNPSGKISFEVS